MPVITLITIIDAPVEKVFDLSRSIDMHQQSMLHTNEKAIAGRTSGLIEEGETVTCQAKHLFKTRKFTSKITAMKPYSYFRDEMVEGDFRSVEHDHYFKKKNEGTEMKDVFKFETPYGIMGKVAEALFLTNYLKRLLKQRNNIIKTEAEKLL